MSETPYAIAVAAGMLAAVNPCGFALLPAYLALIVAGDSPNRADSRSGRLGAVVRSLAAAGAMTAGFVAVFAAFGLIVAPLALSVGRFLPWATVVIGVGLVGFGGWLVAGWEIAVVIPTPRPGRPARSLRWAVGYGVAYAVASLSCTVAPFLALTAAAMGAGSIAAGVGVFAGYAAGIGVIVGTLSLSAALARDALVARLRRDYRTCTELAAGCWLSPGRTSRTTAGTRSACCVRLSRLPASNRVISSTLSPRPGPPPNTRGYEGDSLCLAAAARRLAAVPLLDRLPPVALEGRLGCR